MEIRLKAIRVCTFFILALASLPALAQQEVWSPRRHRGEDAALNRCESDVQDLREVSAGPDEVHHFEILLPCTSGNGPTISRSGYRYQYVESEVVSRICDVISGVEYCDPLQRVTFWRVYWYNLDLLSAHPSDLGPPQCNVSVGNPINIAARNKYEEATDIDDARGLLLLKRHYNSQAKTSGLSQMGRGWTHSYSAFLKPQHDGSGPVEIALSTGRTLSFDSVDGSWVSRIVGAGRLVELSSNHNERWAYYSNDGETLFFSATGRLEAIIRAGLRVGLQYESADEGRLSRVVDHTGRSLEFSYGYGDRVSSVVSSWGAGVTYHYIEQADLRTLVGASYADGRDRRYQYMGGSLTAILDGDDQLLGQYTYNDGVPTSTLSKKHPGLFEITYEKWPSSSDPTTIILIKRNGLAWNRITLKNRGGRAQPTEYMWAKCSGNEDDRFITYDTDGRKIQSVGFSGLRTDYGYDPFGSVSSKDYQGNLSEDSRVLLSWHPLFGKPLLRRVENEAADAYTEISWQYNDRGQEISRSQSGSSDSQIRTYATTYCEQEDVASGLCPTVGLTIAIDGPRTDVNDSTQFLYRMTDAPGCSLDPYNCEYRGGDLWKVVDASGGVTENIRYDSAGRLISVQATDGTIADHEYNARGLITAIKSRGSNEESEADDLITRYEYSTTDLLTRLTQSDGSTIEYSYDEADHLIGVTDALGNTIEFTLDAVGNPIQVDTRDGSGVLRRTLSRIYNSLDWMVTLADSNSNPTDFSYFSGELLNKITDPLGRSTGFQYDSFRRITRVGQNYQSGVPQIKTYFDYDAFGNLAAVTDPKGLETNYTYNAFGDLLQLDSPDTGTTTYAYDSAGNRTGQVDARGQASSYVYDALNRLTGIGYAGAADQNVTYVYDTVQPACEAGETFAVGRLSAMADASGSTQYCYDRFGQMVRKVQVTNGQAFTLRYAYTKSGQLNSLTYPDGSVADYVRDAQGQVAEVGVTSPGGSREVLLIDASYAPFGPATGWAYGNGRILSRSHDLDYRPESILDGATGGLDLGYSYDPAGNLTALRTADLAEPPRATFDYDALNRLTAFKDGATGDPIESYAYDAAGNRTGFTNAGGAQFYVYPTDSHRLTSVAGVPRSYDAVGNTTTIGSAREFVYNAANRLSQVKQGGAVTMHYAYNGKGERVRRHLGVDDVTTVYDEAGKWLGDYDATGIPLQQAIWLDNNPVGLLVGAAGVNRLHYVQPDHLSTPRAVIDPIRNVAVWNWSLASEAFGNSPPNQDPDNDGTSFVFDMRFPGQRYDSATGLNYNYFRDYEPGTGRYPQSDPIGLNGGISTFSYAWGMPLKAFDASGLLAFDHRCTSAQRMFISSEIVRLSNEITQKASPECGDGDCDMALMSEALRFLSKQAVIGCRQGWECASAVVGLDEIHFYGPYIGAPDSSEISGLGRCGCFRGTLLHEAIHHVRPQYEENKVREESSKCVSCSGNLREDGTPL